MKTREKEQYIFGMIFLFSNQLQAIADRDGGDITLKQWFLLKVIQHMEKVSPNINTISEFMGYSRQNARKLLDKLERKGYVEMRKSSTDSRAQNVFLTQKSLDYFLLTEDYGNMLIDDIFNGVTNEEMEALCGAFRTISQNINYLNSNKTK